MSCGIEFTSASQIPEHVRRMAVAFHEAGHALVGILRGLQVTGIVLWPPRHLSGEAQFPAGSGAWVDVNTDAGYHAVQDRIVTAFAGQVAEAKYWAEFSGTYRPQIVSHRHDDAEIERLVRAIDVPSSEAEALKTHCRAQAEHAINESICWDAIREIADLLCKTLDVRRTTLDELLVRHHVINP